MKKVVRIPRAAGKGKSEGQARGRHSRRAQGKGQRNIKEKVPPTAISAKRAQSVIW